MEPTGQRHQLAAAVGVDDGFVAAQLDQQQVPPVIEPEVEDGVNGAASLAEAGGKLGRVGETLFIVAADDLDQPVELLAPLLEQGLVAAGR